MKFQVILNTWAREAFRDQADQDYISARAIYRLEFREQFYWASLQSLEKYLKAILLFNRKSARFTKDTRGKKEEYSHNIIKLMDDVNEIEDIDLTFSDTHFEFIRRVNSLGPNRYFDRCTYSKGNELEKLDCVVWSVRRFCEYFNFEVDQDGDKVGFRKTLINQRTNKSYERRPWSLPPIQGGRLEGILEGKYGYNLMKALTWRNVFFAKYRRKPPRLGMGSANPPNVRQWIQDKEVRKRLSQYVKLFKI